MRILLPALLTFGAGLVFGFAAGLRSGAPPAPTLAPDLAAYEQGLSRVLELDAGQRQDLRTVLAYYEVERRRVFDASRPLLEPRLAELDRRFEPMIHGRVLRPEQRERALQLALPGPPLSAAPADR